MFPYRYENFLLLADFKTELTTTTVCDFCEIYNLKKIIKDKTCFKNPSAPTCKDLIITNQPRAFKHYMVIETGFSDFHKMCVAITLCEKCPNTVFFLVRIQSKYGKIQTRKNSIFGHFSHRVMETHHKQKPSTVKYRKFKNFSMILFSKISKAFCQNLIMKKNVPFSSLKETINRTLEKTCSL